MLVNTVTPALNVARIIKQSELHEYGRHIRALLCLEREREGDATQCITIRVYISGEPSGAVITAD